MRPLFRAKPMALPLFADLSIFLVLCSGIVNRGFSVLRFQRILPARMAILAVTFAIIAEVLSIVYADSTRGVR
jgi:hypothetical protein